MGKTRSRTTPRGKEASGPEASQPGRWLFKEEPSRYSFADLQRDGATVWDGVANNLARKHLRQVRQGDQVFYYHTGGEKAVVGVMEVVSDPGPEPGSDDPASVAVRVRPVRQLLQSVPLERIKADPLLSTWDLVRLPRLSVVPVTNVQWRRVEELANLPRT
jgi:predicted RNA-binding protein with PUA-like domain